MQPEQPFKSSATMNVNAKAWTPGGQRATTAPSQPPPSSGFSSSAPAFQPNQSYQPPAPQFNQNASFHPQMGGMQQNTQQWAPQQQNQGYNNFGGNGQPHHMNQYPNQFTAQHQQQQAYGGNQYGQPQHQQPFYPNQQQQPMYNQQHMQQNQRNQGGSFKPNGYPGKQPWNQGGHPGGNQGGRPQYVAKAQRNDGMGYNGFNQGGGYNDFNSNQQQFDRYKAQNQPLQSGFVPPAQPSPAVAGAPWKQFTKRFNPNLSLADKEKDQLNKCGVTDGKQVQEIKDLLILLKAAKDDKLSDEQEKKIKAFEPFADKSAEQEGEAAAPPADTAMRKKYLENIENRKRTAGALNMRLFFQIGSLPLCQTQDKPAEDLKHCMASLMLEREVHDTIDLARRQPGGGGRGQRGGRGQGGGHAGRGRGGHHGHNDNAGDDNFARGVRGGKNEGFARHLDEERARLRKEAQEMKDRITKPKNVVQKIKLILNLITPDNFERKRDELRSYLFGDTVKTADECKALGIKYSDEHVLKESDIDPELLETIVQNIFRKAQMEKEYIIFYGLLCETLIRIELTLLGLECKVATMKSSAFRKCLFDQCKTCFSKFFDSEEKATHTATLARPTDTSGLTKQEREKYLDDLEKATVFKQKLFGNNEFVGELFRRKILPESTLCHVFEALLGISELNPQVDDLVVEGAINLMDKVGLCFEENSKKKNKPEKFDNIIKRFEELQNLPDTGADVKLSMRIKLLIKNMFANRASGWQRTQDMNDNGPKTRQEVRKEVEDKHAREQREREEGRGGGGRHGGNYNDNKGGDRDRRGGGGRNDRDRRDGGKQQYQEKKQTYQQKGKNDQPASPNKKGRGGGREEKKTEEAPVEIVEISDEDMGEKLNKNFDSYCASIKQLAEVEDGDEETKQPTPEQLKPSYDVYKELRTLNGKPGDAVLAMLLSRVFGEETQKVEEHLTRYLMHLYKDKILNAHHFNGAISRMADILPDLALDLPAVHSYLYKYVVEPLLAEKILDWKKISWVTPEDKSKQAAEDDDDDIVFGTDPFFKFVGLILAEQWKKSPDSLNDFYKPWAAVVKEKLDKMDDADDTFQAIEEEIGADAAKVVMPLLKA